MASTHVSAVKRDVKIFATDPGTSKKKEEEKKF